MRMSQAYVDVRPPTGTPFLERAERQRPFPAPHRVPVLPRGWAPLNHEQQAAVLDACDRAPECLVFRLGSLWDLGAEYRVYYLTTEHWAGLWVATKAVVGDPDDTDSENERLLGLGSNEAHAVQIAVDFLNWDLQSCGESWRLAVEVVSPANDPRRV